MESNVTKCLRMYRNESQSQVEDISDDFFGSIISVGFFGGIFYLIKDFIF